MSKTAIFFSPEGGNVNAVANKLGAMIGKDRCDVIPVKAFEKDDLNKYNRIILAGSTVGADHWDNEIIVDEWIAFFSKIEDKGLEKKKIALIGLGNSVLYPSHFADGLAILYEKVSALDAEVFGFVNAEGYDFTDSEAVNEEGYFCGLALDEDNESDLTPERLENWIQSLKPVFGF